MASSERSVTVLYPADSLGDIPGEDYADMLEAIIAEHYGTVHGDYVYSIGPGGNGLSTSVRLAGEWGQGEEEDIDPARSVAVQRILVFCEDAFNRCCRGEAVPQN